MPEKPQISAATRAAGATPGPGLASIPIDRIPGALLLVDHNGRLRDASPAALTLFGLTRGELDAVRMMDIEPGLTATQWSERWSWLHDERPVAWESMFSRPGRDPFPVAVDASLDADGGCACLLARDISDRRRIEEAERDREAARARLFGAMEASSEGFALFDADDRLYYSNQRYREMLCGVADVLTPGTTFLEILRHSVSRGAIPEAEGERQEAYIAWRMKRHHRSEGIEHYRADSGLWLRVREQRLDHGDTFVVASDITHVKESQRELADKSAQLQTAYENMYQGIAVLDDACRIVVFNQRFLDTSSLPGLEIRPGMSIVDIWRTLAEEGLYGEGDAEELVAQRMKMVTDGKPYHFVVEQSDGRCLEVRGRPTNEGGHVITHTDITETHRLSRELTYQANHDALTGLANRLRFESAVEVLLDDAREGDSTHALCYLDLDQFKVINDTCGHLAGDELLRQLGGILPDQVRQGDLLARLGGDEFGMLLRNCAIADATRIAEKVRETVDEFRFVWQGRIFRIGASVGVVPIDRASQSIANVLSNADSACYAAKDEGGNRVHVYHPNDTELARRRGDMQWVADINRSLEQNDLVLYEQPIVSLDGTDDERRLEILLRLRDTDGKLFEPKSFMRSAERFGLMGKLDRWVVDTMLDWLNTQDGKRGALTTYFINISGMSLRDADFRGGLIERLQGCSWSGLRVCLEVTETAAVANLANAAVFMEQIGALGHSCALDDFGSGLSSFAYLRNLPVEFLKIDGQFVRDMDHDLIDLAMVKSITEVAQVMGKRTIAEFAETPQVLDRLREIGVDFAQGYAVGHPGPLNDE